MFKLAGIDNGTGLKNEVLERGILGVLV